MKQNQQDVIEQWMKKMNYKISKLYEGWDEYCNSNYSYYTFSFFTFFVILILYIKCERFIYLLGLITTSGIIFQRIFHGWDKR